MSGWAFDLSPQSVGRMALGHSPVAVELAVECSSFLGPLGEALSPIVSLREAGQLRPPRVVSGFLQCSGVFLKAPCVRSRSVTT